ncbi:major head protein [Vibrio phage EniLVp02]
MPIDIKRWEFLLNEANEQQLAPIDTYDRKAVMAQLLENQNTDIKSDPIYRNSDLTQAFQSDGVLAEAVVDGDHGYDATNIASGETSGAITNIGPQVMGMVRRAIPKLIAFDTVGVQAMKGPTSQVFTIRAAYGTNPLDANAREAFHPTAQPDTSFSGQAAAGAIADLPTGSALVVGDVYKAIVKQEVEEIRYFQAITTATLTIAEAGKLTKDEYVALVGVNAVEVDAGMATSIAELQEGFNGSDSNPWNEMTFRIDKQVVEAKSRQLKSQYSIELAQDLKAVHGPNADTIITDMLTTEIMVEMNREIVNLINAQAQIGKTGWSKGAGAAGVFDFADAADVRGARWAGESYKALLIQIEKESNEIARQTGRGAANFIIASRNVVSALAMTDVFVGPAAQGMQNGTMITDTNKAVFAGVLGGRYKVFIDQYALADYFTVGLKGQNEMEAGIIYSPYVALTPLRGSDSRNMQPVLGFKTRYGLQVNPFADPTRTLAQPGKVANGMPTASTMGKNCFYRRVWVKGL